MLSHQIKVNNVLVAPTTTHLEVRERCETESVMVQSIDVVTLGFAGFNKTLPGVQGMAHPDTTSLTTAFTQRAVVGLKFTSDRKTWPYLVVSILCLEQYWST